MKMKNLVNLPTQLVHMSRKKRYIYLRYRTLLISQRITSNSLLAKTWYKLQLYHLLWLYLANTHRNIIRRDPPI